MQKHVRILGILHIVYSCLGLLIGLLVLVFLAGLGLAIDQMPDTENFQVSVSSILGVIGFFVALLLTLFSLPGIIGGIGLLKYREWARILIIIVGFFDLLHIPLGTALGVYTIWVLFNSETVSLFGQPPAAPPVSSPQ